MNQNGRYKLISPYDDNACHAFVKFIDTYTVKKEAGVDYKGGFLGVDIDIFPLDGEPTDEKEFDTWYSNLMRVYKHYSICNMQNTGSLKRKVGVPIVRLITGGKKNLLKKAKKLHLKYPYDLSIYVGAIESAFNSKGNRFEKQWFDNSIEIEFEGHMLKAPADYDKILSKLYGDYMKLPPAEKQVSHHTNIMYIKDGCEI